MGKTVETVLLWFRVIFLVALFTPSLLIGAFISQEDGLLRRFWLHLLLRSLEAAGNVLYSESICIHCILSGQHFFDSTQ